MNAGMKRDRLYFADASCPLPGSNLHDQVIMGLPRAQELGVLWRSPSKKTAWHGEVCQNSETKDTGKPSNMWRLREKFLEVDPEL